MSHHIVNIIGAGLAGCEAAWQAANRGIQVRLYDMKPLKYSPAHSLDSFAELVCSNSFRSDRLENAVGLLKEEMRILNSIIMRCADAERLPAGEALAVDRIRFSKLVTDEIKSHPNISIINKEMSELPENGATIIATGPLTSDSLSECICQLTGKECLYFYDAAAPIVTYESIDLEKAFRASRYGRGSNDYINCPMDEKQYKLFYDELVNAEVVPIKEFEKEILFSGCMPVESMSYKGFDTLRYGPLKPVGLKNPHTGAEPYAVVQLRQDNAEGSLFNIVGFQTHLKWPEQKRVFRLIPGLEEAEFVRYGVMHRNTFIHSPGLLNETYQMKEKPFVYFAGQITGVEGYIESAASGLVAGTNAALACQGKERLVFPPDTAIGSLASYISGSALGKFQPMNINFGLIKQPKLKFKNKKDRYISISENALKIIREIVSSILHTK